MLVEYMGVRQIPGQRGRRWFSSRDEELIVWYADDGSIFGFQLCYDLQSHEKALTWLPHKGFSHNRVDDGEGVGLGHKRAPVLVPNGVFDVATVSRRFLEISASLPDEVREFVSRKLREYAPEHLAHIVSRIETPKTDPLRPFKP
jgi:hypothetical protein